jgi:uncharacterized protein YcbX
VSALNFYPVKSCAGTPLTTAELGRRGIVHDREFMLVDARRRFVTQREQPRLALIKPVRTDSSLVLHAPGMPRLEVQLIDGQRSAVTIWDDRVVAADQGARPAQWLREYLGEPLRLVRLPDDVVRPVDPDFATRPEDEVGFADGIPPCSFPRSRSTT